MSASACARTSMNIAGLVFFSVLAAAPASAEVWLNDTDEPLECDFCNLQFPASVSVDGGQNTGPISGQIYEAGVTDAFQIPPNVFAQLGLGPAGSDPRQGGWQWVDALFNVQVGNNAEYSASLTPLFAGEYSYTFRFSLDGGQSFTAGDLDGAGSNAGLGFDPAQLGALTVVGSVPEPSTYAMLVGGLGILALFARRRRR